MVLDDNTVIAGSMSCTARANGSNDQNVVILGCPYPLSRSEGGPVVQRQCRRLAEYFRGEVIRIWRAGERY